MHLFWLGVIIGGVTAFVAAVFLGAQEADEKDSEIKYLRRELAKQASAELQKETRREAINIGDQ